MRYLEQRAAGRALEGAFGEDRAPAQPGLPDDAVERPPQVGGELVAMVDSRALDLERRVGVEGDQVRVVARRDPALVGREACELYLLNSVFRKAT